MASVGVAGLPDTSELFGQAADLLRTEGWIQGQDYGAGGFCLMGAIGSVCATRFTGSDVSSLMYQACLDEVWRVLQDQPDNNPRNWNDAYGRTKTQVLRLLDGLAGRA